MSTVTHDVPRRRVAVRVGRALVDLVLLVVTLAGVAYVVPWALGYDRYVITGGSMSGTFEKGSLVLEQEVPVDDLEVGDVITYQPPADTGVSTLVTHRISSVSTTEDGVRQFVTKGDANPDPDPWKFSLTDGTQPVVQHAVPYVGFALIAMADREVRMFAVGGPAALIALGAMVQLVRGLREPRTKAPTGAEPSAARA
ncbi:signal peptidase I [Aeromicrobium massiliense]|uniref:signal peptidase I n=1 Tax=Aeromicrobium massiliense TaxID=1464554 RepID=UPI00030EEC27|nr:signal peptidase I [Aeromicrobium massiliense]